MPDYSRRASLGSGRLFRNRKSGEYRSCIRMPFIDPYWSRKKVEKALKSD
jgi:hypothetical protein